MLAQSPLVAFVACTELDRARTFYETTLGLDLVDAEPFALVFRCGPTELRVTNADTPAAAPYTVLGWVVEDIEAAVDDLVARGVEFTIYDGMGQDTRGIWTAPGGARVAWFLDPDANNLSVTQARPAS